MPDWYGDHKFMMVPASPFQTTRVRLAVAGMMAPLSSILDFARRGALALVAGAVVLQTAPAAQAQSLPIIRDAEIEALVRDYARPLFEAAGLSKSGIEIVLVNAPAFNAFVAGRRIFVNTGALVISETPNG